MVSFYALIYLIVTICVASTAEISFSIPFSIMAGAILIAMAIDKKNK